MLNLIKEYQKVIKKFEDKGIWVSHNLCNKDIHLTNEDDLIVELAKKHNTKLEIKPHDANYCKAYEISTTIDGIRIYCLCTTEKAIELGLI